jgi:large subunit ribosomal protein L30
MSLVKIRQIKSSNGTDAAQRATLESLGLRRIGHTVEHEDRPQLRGMIRRVAYLVKIEES